MQHGSLAARRRATKPTWSRCSNSLPEVREPRIADPGRDGACADEAAPASVAAQRVARHSASPSGLSRRRRIAGLVPGARLG